MATEYTLLQLVQEFTKRNSLPKPSTVVGSLDDTVLQVWGTLNEGIQDICDRYNLEELMTYLSFTHANGDNYLAYDFGTNSADWKYLIPNTLWSNTDRIRVNGPLTLVEWQTLTRMLVSTTMYQYILLGKAIHIFGVPTPPDSTTFSVYYQSKYGVADSAATDAPLGLIDSFLTDASTCRIPSYLMLADLNWRWKMKKSLPYAEEQRVCEQMLMNYVGRQGQGTLVLDQDTWNGPNVGPGLLIPAGNWPLP